VDLVIDGGRSGCRAALYQDDRLAAGVVAGSGVPAVAEAGGAAAAEAVTAAFAEVVAALGVRGRALDSVCVGVTGVLGPGAAAELVAATLRPLVRAGRILVTSDVVTGYCGAVGLAPGVVVAAGTGAITLAVGPRRAARVDGWGWLLGDAGSGYEIGRRGLAAALRAADGRDGSPLLAKLAERELGPLHELVRIVHGASNPVRVVAGFAERVAEAARTGDPLAGAIWADAAAELARSALAAAARVAGPGARLALSWTGGLFAARDLLLEPFLARVAAGVGSEGPALVPAAPLGTPLDGGRLLAGSSLPAPFDALVHQTGGQNPDGRGTAERNQRLLRAYRGRTRPPL
jgi:N-acetylglucosamine kinase-like BadF-type ATPase